MLVVLVVGIRHQTFTLSVNKRKSLLRLLGTQSLRADKKTSAATSNIMHLRSLFLNCV